MWLLLQVLAVSAADVKVARELIGAGLKKELKTTVVMPGDCEVVVHERVTEEWFVDQSEIPPSQNVVFHAPMDIELPKSLSKPQQITVAGATTNHAFSYQIPIHMRYNDCSDSESYTQVALPPPEILAWCGEEKIQGIYGEKVYAKMPVGRKTHGPAILCGTFAVVLIGAGLIAYNLLKYNWAKSKGE